MFTALPHNTVLKHSRKYDSTLKNVSLRHICFWNVDHSSPCDVRFKIFQVYKLLYNDCTTVPVWYLLLFHTVRIKSRFLFRFQNESCPLKLELLQLQLVSIYKLNKNPSRQPRTAYGVHVSGEQINDSHGQKKVPTSKWLRSNVISFINNPRSLTLNLSVSNCIVSVSFSIEIWRIISCNKWKWYCVISCVLKQ